MFWRKRHKKLAVALMCADWRLHQKSVELNARIARHLKVDGADVIAVPGPDGLPATGRETEWDVAAAQIKLLIGAHSPEALAVVAHQRCAGHPVSDDQHDQDVAVTARALKEKTGFEGSVFALVAVYRSDTNWELKQVAVY
jgi:hypothetical protein